jgi:hypothetical protein
MIFVSTVMIPIYVPTYYYWNCVTFKYFILPVENLNTMYYIITPIHRMQQQQLRQHDQKEEDYSTIRISRKTAIGIRSL